MLNALRNKSQALLEKETLSLPFWQKLLIRSFQIIYATIRDLSDGQLSLQAMSLVYTTLITLVPLLAISFSVLKGFGVHNQIEPVLLNLLEGLGPEKGQEVADRVIDFVDNVKVGVLGALGLGLLIYAVIALMQKIEAAFNYIWRVGEDRTLAQRFSDYLSVLLMGPLFIFISAGITTAVRNSDAIVYLEEVAAFGFAIEFATLLVPWLVMALGFTFIYVYMPNTRVRISSAFAGAMVAALLWKAMGYVFASFIAGSANYVAIYAAFATLIILMIWLYASWLVVLVGANVAFYVQYPRYLRLSRSPLILSPRLRMALGLSALSVIARTYYEESRALTLEELSKELRAPVLALQEIMHMLESASIVALSHDEPSCYYPAVPLDQTSLEKVIQVLENYGKEDGLQVDRIRFEPKVLSIISQIEEARQQAVASQTIAQALIGGENDQTRPASSESLPLPKPLLR